MTKDILLKIQGMHFGEQIGEEKDLEEEEPIEVITAGNYYNKNGKHYIKYEEIMEGEKENTSSLIKIQGDTLEVTKKGLNNVHMIFQKNKKNMSYYNMPFGNLLVGIEASQVEVKEEKDCIRVDVDYSLEVNYEHLADCSIHIDVCSKDQKETRLLG